MNQKTHITKKQAPLKIFMIKNNLKKIFLYLNILKYIIYMIYIYTCCFTLINLIYIFQILNKKIIKKSNKKFDIFIRKF